MARRLVVLASGWAKQDFLWVPLAKRLEAAGYDTVCAHFPHNGFGPIEDSAEKIGCVIEEMRPFYEHLTFVGHSMGGLLGRFLVQHLEMDQIDAYVSLGTPHNGTWLAWAGLWSHSARQMRVGSDFIRGLNETPWPSKIPAMALQAQMEEIVLPQRHAEISFGKNQVIPWTTHVSLPLAWRTYAEIYGWLTYGVFGESGPHGYRGFSSSLSLAGGHDANE